MFLVKMQKRNIPVVKRIKKSFCDFASVMSIVLCRRY